MAKSSVWRNALLFLIFHNDNAANIGDATGLRGSSTTGSLYFSLHTADPGVGGSQNTSECAYTGYARVAVARSSGGFTITGDSVSPAAPVVFPIGTAGSGTATFWAVGTAASGAGEILYSGTVTPNIITGNGVTPELTTLTAITED